MDLQAYQQKNEEDMQKLNDIEGELAKMENQIQLACDNIENKHLNSTLNQRETIEIP